MLDHPALFTDLYQLTMMQGYWAAGRTAERASFELFFRRIPEKGGYAVAAGIDRAIDEALAARFTPQHRDYLASLGLFKPAFLDWLAGVRFTGDIRAVREGTLAFPHEPLLEVVGPLAEAQWLETLLLNLVNFPTLVATKASRIVQAARPANVVEFGLRRAQGPDGGRTVSRSAYLAGCVATSNVEAGLLFGVPVAGTHAHSWVMSFPTEAEAFRAYADAYPDRTTLLIDTYDTLKSGLPNAIAEAKRLSAAGHRLHAIRLDSGDLAWLAKACRRELDAAGLHEVKVMASSDIDEYLIQELKVQGAPIDVYGVGTRLATAYQEPALGGVFKLVALDRGGGHGWEPKIKLSSNPAKSTIPGRKQVWRWHDGSAILGDALAIEGDPAPTRMVHPVHEHMTTDLPTGQLTPLLETVVQGGRRVREAQPLAAGRAWLAEQLAGLPAEHQRLSNPHTYRVGLSEPLHAARKAMLSAAAVAPE